MVYFSYHMAITDLFSKRQKRERGDVSDVYMYDKVPPELRVQIVHIIQDALGNDRDRGTQSRSRAAYESLRQTLAREYGKFHLTEEGDPEKDFFAFVLRKATVDHLLDCVELAFRLIVEKGSPSSSYPFHTHPRIKASEAIEELNGRFRENAFGYEFASGDIIKIDSQLVHAEVVRPALGLLTDKALAGANKEYLGAHEHYRQGRHEEAITEALKSLESVLKVICAKRKWPYKETDTAKTLLDTCFSQGLVSDYLQSEFAALRSTLESGVPTVRNKEAGHGQGATARQVPEHLAAYILHLTASSIVFLVRAEQALP